MIRHALTLFAFAGFAFLSHVGLEVGHSGRFRLRLGGRVFSSMPFFRYRVALSAQVLHTLIAYYAANPPENSGWVVLPVTNLDYFFGDNQLWKEIFASPAA